MLVSLATLGAVSFQTVALARHETTHCAERLQATHAGTVTLDEGACDLCLSAHAHSAVSTFVPAVAAHQTFVALEQSWFFFQLPVRTTGLAEARAPPRAA